MEVHLTWIVSFRNSVPVKTSDGGRIPILLNEALNMSWEIRASWASNAFSCLGSLDSPAQGTVVLSFQLCRWVVRFVSLVLSRDDHLGDSPWWHRWTVLRNSHHTILLNSVEYFPATFCSANNLELYSLHFYFHGEISSFSGCQSSTIMQYPHL